MEGTLPEPARQFAERAQTQRCPVAKFAPPRRRDIRALVQYAVRDRANYGKLNEEEIITWTDTAHWYPYLRLAIPFLVRLCVVL